MTTTPTIPRWVAVRDPHTGQRWKPAVARLRDGHLIVWAQVGKDVQRVVEVASDITLWRLDDGVLVEVTDEQGGAWRIDAAKCGCGARALKRFDPDVEDT